MIKGLINFRYDINKLWILLYMFGIISYPRFINVVRKIRWILYHIFYLFLLNIFKIRGASFDLSKLILIFQIN